jgi:hypothetical protein
MTQPIYAVINDANGNPNTIQRTDPNGQIWSIPMVEANSDYQAYLAYVANGNRVPDSTLPSESSIPSIPQAGE